MDLGLGGRVVVVRGGSKGIGLALVRGLLDEGARVVAASRTPSPELHELPARELLHVAVDLTARISPRSGSTTGTELVVDCGLVKAA